MDTVTSRIRMAVDESTAGGLIVIAAAAAFGTLMIFTFLTVIEPEFSGYLYRAEGT
jgi:hypothetical protein